MPCGAILNRFFDTEPTPRPESYREDIETAERIGADKTQFYQHVRAACESGWDFSSRWLANANALETIRTTEIIPVDLNALLVTLEQTLADATSGAEAMRYEAAAKVRIEAINTYLFSKEKSGYFDYHSSILHLIIYLLLGALFILLVYTILIWIFRLDDEDKDIVQVITNKLLNK